MGAERYWSEIYFARATRDLANASWVQAAIEGYNDGEGTGVHGTVIMEIERELSQEAVADVQVAIVDPDMVQATPEEAIAYLHELWDVLYPSVEPTPNPTPERNKPPE